MPVLQMPVADHLTNVLWFMLLSERGFLQGTFEAPFPKSVPD